MASHRGRHELLNKWAQETRPRGKKKGPWSLEERRKEVLGLRGEVRGSRAGRGAGVLPKGRRCSPILLQWDLLSGRDDI